MRTIKVEEAQVGDVLAEPLVNPNGQILLPKGAKLSPAVISRFRSWNVEVLEVEGDDPSEQDREERVKALETRFEQVVDDPLMAQIKEIALAHLRAH